MLLTKELRFISWWTRVLEFCDVEDGPVIDALDDFVDTLEILHMPCGVSSRTSVELIVYSWTKLGCNLAHANLHLAEITVV